MREEVARPTLSIETTANPASVEPAGRDESEPAPSEVAADAGMPRALYEKQSLDVEDAEHLGDVIRLRKAVSFGALTWPLFFGADLALHQFAYPESSLAFQGALRTLQWGLVLLCLLRLRRAPLPTRKQLVGLDTLVFVSAALGTSLTCLSFGGLASHYGSGITFVLVCRAAFVQVPWRTALIPAGLSALSYPVVQLGAALFSSRAAAQLKDAHAVSVFCIHNVQIFTTLGFVVVGGHVVWGLRRQIFEKRSIDRYRLLRPIARGGMGEVWVAYHEPLRREVALKMLRTDRGFDSTMLRRFEREVQATMELSHPNTVRVFDYGLSEDGLCYYAMELLSGQDLGSWVALHGPMAPGTSVRLMLQVAGAVAEAHARGIVHRDLKPENVFVCGDSSRTAFAKVLDFGIARRTDARAESALTLAERVLGTPQYMSPEQTLGRPADARSDVYALGAVLYFMLAGVPPFAERSGTAVMIAHAQEVPPPPSARRGSALPAELEALVLRCLAKDPRERYADAAQLSEALASVSLKSGYDAA